MKISLNGKVTEVDQTALKNMMISQGYQASHLAVAVNGDFIPKSQHESYQIKEGDEVDIVAPMQGG